MTVIFLRPADCLQINAAAWLVWYNHTHTQTHTDKMLFGVICLWWVSRMRLLTCASCRQDWVLWNLALPWLWHAEAAGIRAAQAAGKERRWVIQRDGQQMEEWQRVWVKHRPTEHNVYPDLMNTCWEGPPGVIRKPKLSELTRRPSGEWKRQTECHHWPFKVQW